VSALEECRAVLKRVSEVKMPNLRERPGDLPTGVQFSAWRIEQLESYLLLTAEVRQEAHLAKLIVQEALDQLQDQWADIEGWEIELATNSKKTAAEVLEAKRRTNPDLYSSIQTGKRLVDRLGDQIKRLEKDDGVSSRAYTLLTGG
jgi:hypothetical protein